MSLSEKAIIITGSTTGIGRAIAEQCVAHGASVLIHGRNESRGKTMCEELGANASLHLDDLSDPNAAERLISAAISRFGRLDGIVNNAAAVVRSDITSTTPELFDQVMTINARAPLLLAQAGLEHLAKTRGCILNIGSLNAYCGEKNLLAYSISKGALMTLSKNLGDWLQREYEIRVNHFNVGWTLTENEHRYKQDDGLPPDWHAKLPSEIAPTGKLMEPTQIAKIIAWWLSDDARPISGSVIDLDQYPLIGHIPWVQM